VGWSRRHGVDALLTDFDRTLVWLFEDQLQQQEACEDVLAICAARGVPVSIREAGGDPYDLWTEAYRWMLAASGPAEADGLDHTIASCLAAHELRAAGSAKLVEGVEATLKRLHALGIPVAVVSNNATEAVWQGLKAGRVEGLVTVVLGREPDGNLHELKPSPVLLRNALAMLDCAPERALFVGDSVTDMVAGRVAGMTTLAVHRHSRAMEPDLKAAGARQVLAAFADLGSLF
jgi:HAD superfamily hydrolase (TIGR01662 family)